MQLTDLSNKTPKQVATEIIESLEQHWSIDLKTIISNEAISEADRIKRLRAKILEAALADIDEFDADSGKAPRAGQHDTLTESVLRGDAIEIEPNFSVTEHNYNIICGYRGADVYNYVFNLSKRLEAMSKAQTPGQLAIETIGAGLISVGTAWAKLTWTAWRTGGQTLLQACRTGVTQLGLKTAITVVVIVLTAVITYLLIDNPKKILGVVFNNTDDHLVVNNWKNSGGDLYMEHGVMVNFMEDHADGDLDSPLIQIRKRYFFEAGDPDNCIFAGIYFGDRNVGLRGSEGVMLFSSYGNDNIKIAHQFAVPYTNDNGTNMRKINGPVDLPSLFRELYDGRNTRVDINDGGYRLLSTVNDPRGGVVGLIAAIQKNG